MEEVSVDLRRPPEEDLRIENTCEFPFLKLRCVLTNSEVLFMSIKKKKLVHQKIEIEIRYDLANVIMYSKSMTRMNEDLLV